MQTRWYTVIKTFLLLVFIVFTIITDFVLPKTLSGKTGDHHPFLALQWSGVREAEGGMQGERCPDITGRWSWFVGGVVTFRTDGTGEWKASPEAKHTLSVRWQCETTNVVYTLIWQQGLIDTLLLSEDGRVLKGQNQFGVTVEGIHDDGERANRSKLLVPAHQIDPNLVGTWELEVRIPTPAGPIPVLWEIRADGTYRIDAQHLSHAGTLMARDGQWSLESKTSGWRDNGRYELTDWTTLLAHGILGPGRWHRREPRLKLETTTSKADRIPHNLPQLSRNAAELARRWREDALLVMLQVKPPAGRLGIQVTMNFFSPSTGGGLWITATPEGSSFQETRVANWGEERIPFEFLDLPETWAIAQQHGVLPPLGRTMLRIEHPPGHEPILIWSISSGRRNSPGIAIDAATGIVFTGELSGYIAEYNRMWEEAVEGLRRLFARPAPLPTIDFDWGSSSSAPSSSTSGDSSSTWHRDTALQNAWGSGDMDAYNRIQSGTPTWEDCSRYGGC